MRGELRSESRGDLLEVPFHSFRRTAGRCRLVEFEILEAEGHEDADRRFEDLFFGGVPRKGAAADTSPQIRWEVYGRRLACTDKHTVVYHVYGRMSRGAVERAQRGNFAKKFANFGEIEAIYAHERNSEGTRETHGALGAMAGEACEAFRLIERR